MSQNYKKKERGKRGKKRKVVKRNYIKNVLRKHILTRMNELSESENKKSKKFGLVDKIKRK
jgi:hypothetical protein